MDSCEYFLHLLRKTKYMFPHLHVKDHKISLSTESVTINFHWLTCFCAYQVQTGSPRLASSAWHSTPVFRWRTVLCRWYAGGREVVSGRRPPVCWMSDRHAELTAADRSFATTACPRIWNGLSEDAMYATSFFTDIAATTASTFISILFCDCLC